MRFLALDEVGSREMLLWPKWRVPEEENENQLKLHITLLLTKQCQILINVISQRDGKNTHILGELTCHLLRRPANVAAGDAPPGSGCGGGRDPGLVPRSGQRQQVSTEAARQRRRHHYLC